MFNNNNRERERERERERYQQSEQESVVQSERESHQSQHKTFVFSRDGNTTTRKNARGAHIGLLAVALKQRDRFDDDDDASKQRVKQKEALVKEASMK